MDPKKARCERYTPLTCAFPGFLYLHRPVRQRPAFASGGGGGPQWSPKRPHRRPAPIYTQSKNRQRPQPESRPPPRISAGAGGCGGPGTGRAQSLQATSDDIRPCQGSPWDPFEDSIPHGSRYKDHHFRPAQLARAAGEIFISFYSYFFFYCEL